LVLETIPDARARWVRLLLASGFSPVVVETNEALVQNVLSGKFSSVLTRISGQDAGLLGALKVFRDRLEFRHIQFLLVLDIAEESLVLALIKSGFYHLVTRAQSDEIIIEKLNVIAKTLGVGPDRRQHVRVPIMDYENAKMILSLPNSRKLTAMIRNISIGGVQVAFRERIFVRFNQGEVLTDCLLVVKNLDLATDVTVVTTLDKGLQLQYYQLDEGRQNLIAKLVQERIQMTFT
jgi:hypothetical protein